MEALVASAIGLLTAAGIYLILRLRTFPVVVGTTMLSYAVNLFLFASGRLALDLPPIVNPDQPGYTDPLPQALVLTAIVISFGMTAVTVLIALGAYLEGGTDRFDMDGAPESGDETPPDEEQNTGLGPGDDSDGTGGGAPDYDPGRPPSGQPGPRDETAPAPERAR